jgi:RimJ/RimL family protein N-acetyltransferase
MTRNPAAANTAAIALSPLLESDLPMLYRWINDREQVLLNSTYRPVSETQHRQWFEQVQQRSDGVIFAIRVDHGARLIGTCQLHTIDRVNQSAELQIRIGEVAERGRGYGTDAVRHLVRFGFEDLNLHRIWLHVFSRNVAAQRAYEKAGFTREAIQREAAFIDGAYVDVVVMAILNG